jgi:hypothetical protein
MATQKELAKAAQALFKGAATTPVTPAIKPPVSPLPTANNYRGQGQIGGLAYSGSRQPYMLTHPQMDLEQGIPAKPDWSNQRYGAIYAPYAITKGLAGGVAGTATNLAMAPFHGVAEAGRGLGVPGAASASESIGDIRTRAIDIRDRGLRQMRHPLFDRSLDSQLGSEVSRLNESGHPGLAGVTNAANTAANVASVASTVRSPVTIPTEFAGGLTDAYAGAKQTQQTLATGDPAQAAMNQNIPATADVAAGMSDGQLPDPAEQYVNPVLSRVLNGGQSSSGDDSTPQPQFFPNPSQVAPSEAIAQVQQLPPEQQPHAAREYVEGQVATSIREALGEQGQMQPGAEDKAKAELAARTVAGRNTPEEVSRAVQTSAHEQGGDLSQPHWIEQLLVHFQKLPPEQKMLLVLGVPLTLAGLAVGAFGDDWLTGSVLGLGGLAAIGGGMGMFGRLGGQQQPGSPAATPPAAPPQPAATHPAENLDWTQPLTEKHPILQQYAAGGQDPAVLEPDDVRHLLTDYSTLIRGSAMKPQLQAVIKDMTPEQQQQFRAQVMQGAGDQAGGANYLLNTLGI